LDEVCIEHTEHKSQFITSMVNMSII